MLIAHSCHDALVMARNLVRSEGVVTAPDRSESNLGNYAFREVSNVAMTVTDPRNRVVRAPSFDLPSACLRALWMLSAQSAIEDLESVFPAIGNFSDDGRCLTGSAVGYRVINSVASGTAQIDGALARLRETPNTRRATVSNFLPDDASRRSRDIPCLLSLSWRLRDGSLECTSVMRANNVSRLLAYNLFEYTLLTDCMASMLGCAIGPHCHFVVSLHEYEYDFGAVHDAGDPTVPRLMSAPPRGVDAFRQAGEILECVRALRRAVHVGSSRDFRLAWQRGTDREPFWAQLFSWTVEHDVRESQSLIESAAITGNEKSTGRSGREEVVCA